MLPLERKRELLQWGAVSLLALSLLASVRPAPPPDAEVLVTLNDPSRRNCPGEHTLTLYGPQVGNGVRTVALRPFGDLKICELEMSEVVAVLPKPLEDGEHILEVTRGDDVSLHRFVLSADESPNPSVRGSGPLRANLDLVTDAGTVREGERFELRVLVSGPPALEVTTVHAEIQFDPQVLELVDRGHATGPVLPGNGFSRVPEAPAAAPAILGHASILDARVRHRVLRSAGDNVMGRVQFWAGRGSITKSYCRSDCEVTVPSAPVSPPFLLATLTFRALESRAQTRIELAAPATFVLSERGDVTGPMKGAVLQVVPVDE